MGARVSAGSDGLRESERRKLNVIEGMILAGLLGGCAMLLAMREQLVQLNTTIAYQAEEMKNLREQVAGFNTLSTRVTTLEVRVEQHDRALGMSGARSAP